MSDIPSGSGNMASGQAKLLNHDFTFAPNVTPTTFTSPSQDEEEFDADLVNYRSLFPPSETPAPSPARRRVSPSKIRAPDHVKRPSNSFMLFRADFVRQKHVPQNIEACQGSSLQKVIGTLWKNLPPAERRIWELRAKKEKEDHKRRYPDYRFRPVHTKGKKKEVKDKPVATEEEEQRVAEVAQLLLTGKKGQDLVEAVRDSDAQRSQPPRFSTLNPEVMPISKILYAQERPRRSSSVPLPDMASPSLPFFPNISQRPAYPIRRPSSANDITIDWEPAPLQLVQEPEQPLLPSMVSSFFAPDFAFNTASYATAESSEYGLAPPYDGQPNRYRETWTTPQSQQLHYESSPALSSSSSLPSIQPTDSFYHSSLVSPQPIHYAQVDAWRDSTGPVDPNQSCMPALSVNGLGGAGTAEYPSPYGMEGLSIYEQYPQQNHIYYDQQ